MVTKVSYVIALLILVLYYGYFFNGERFPTSFCAGARYLTKEGLKKYQFVPIVAGCVLSVLMGIVAFNLASLSTFRVILAPISVICALTYFAVSTTITCYKYKKLYNAHNILGEIGGVTLIILSTLFALAFGQIILIPIEVLIILSLKAISKQVTRSVLNIFWYEMSAFIMFFLTTGVLILELL